MRLSDENGLTNIHKIVNKIKSKAGFSTFK